MKGSIAEKGAGKWLVRVYAGRVEGKTTHVNRTVHGSKREAQLALAKLVAEVSAGKVLAGQAITVTQLILRWLDDVSPQRTPRTIHEYRRLATHDIFPALGTKRIDRLTARDIDSYYRSLLEHGLSPASIRRSHALLHASLGRAVKWGLIGTNPVDRASPPTTRRPQVTAPSVTDVTKLIAAARGREDSVLSTAIALAAVTGMRRGELCGLRWSDVDPHQRRLTVSRSLTVTPGQIHIGDTKTHQTRDVALDPAMIGLLDERRLEQEKYARTVGTELVSDPYVLSRDADGSRPCLPDGLGRAYWRLARQSAIPTRFHDLRHFSATQLVGAGIDIRTVAGRLGHADASTTLRVYSHLLAERDRAAAEHLGALALGAKSRITASAAPYILPEPRECGSH
ncbi:MAG TPA: site-specific integrase [Acidimicrobiales bacterium]|nr:site-specific integrase [Acidimicrobiales bacterium]